MKLQKILTSGAIFSAAVISAQAAEVVVEEVEVEEIAVEESALSGWVSLDANSHFMSYGANVWGKDTKDIGDHTLFNPSAGLDYSLGDIGTLYVGMWMDINDLADGDIKNFGGFGSDVQELDLWIGFTHSIDKLTIDWCLQSWLYAGENEGIFDVTFSYDTMFAPYFKIHNRFETVGDGQQKGQMYEIGGTLYEGEYEGLAYGFGIGVGFSFEDYHSGNGADGYTYSFLGANAGYVIYSNDSIEVDLHGGLTYYNTNKNATGNADEGYLTANFGVGFSF